MVHTYPLNTQIVHRLNELDHFALHSLALFLHSVVENEIKTRAAKG